MSVAFSVEIDTGYSSNESIFEFLKTNLLYRMIGKDIIDEFKYVTNFSDKATLDYVLNEKDDKFVPPITQNEIEDRLLKKYSHEELENLTPEELETAVEEVKQEYYNDFVNDQETTENKFTTPKKFMTYSIAPVYENDQWSLDNRVHEHTVNLFEDNAFRFELIRNIFRYNITINFKFDSKNSAYDFATRVYNAINLNKYFYLDPKFLFKIRIPDKLLDLMYVWYNMNDKESVLDYIYSISRYNILIEKDIIKNDYKSVFLKYYNEPLMKITSLSFDESSKSVSMEMSAEIILPNKLITMSSISTELLTARIIEQKKLVIGEVDDIALRIFKDFIKWQIDNNFTDKCFIEVSAQYGIIFDQLEQMLIDKRDEVKTIFKTFVETLDMETCKELFYDNRDCFDVEDYEFDLKYNPDNIIYRILKFDKDYLTKYKDQLGLTDQDLDDLNQNLKEFVLDTSDLSTEEINFIREYLTEKYKIFDVALTTSDLGSNLATHVAKGEEFTEGDYKLLRTLYYENNEANITEIIITDSTVVINLENGEDIKLKLYIDGLLSNNYELIKKEKDWKVVFHENISNKFVEMTFLKRV